MCFYRCTFEAELCIWLWTAKRFLIIETAFLVPVVQFVAIGRQLWGWCSSVAALYWMFPLKKKKTNLNAAKELDREKRFCCNCQIQFFQTLWWNPFQSSLSVPLMLHMVEIFKLRLNYYLKGVSWMSLWPSCMGHMVLAVYCGPQRFCKEL